ncbi:MAG: zinc-dependent alcohol dehydrogenase family protein [Hyphomicrobiaceae bacterium]
MRCRAAVLVEQQRPRPYAQSRPLEVTDVDLDPPGEGEVVVKIGASGLCHSDLSVINGDRPRQIPLVLGHECAGEIVEVGPAVRDLKVGDRVIFVFIPNCGSCVPCSEGRPQLCEPGAKSNADGTLILSGAKRIKRNGHPVAHHVGVSAFAEYAVASQHSLVKIEQSLSFEEAALFGCAVVTGAGAAINTAGVKPGTSVAVVGLGGVGLMGLLAAKAAGAAQVIAVDVVDSKLALARQLGATHTVRADDPSALEQIRDISRGGVHFGLEFASSAKALDFTYKATRRGGTTVTASLPPPTHTLDIPVTQMVAEERTVKGSYMGSCVPKRDIPRFIAMYQQGLLPVDRIMSERVTLDQINEGFDRLADVASVRQLMVN